MSCSRRRSRSCPCSCSPITWRTGAATTWTSRATSRRRSRLSSDTNEVGIDIIETVRIKGVLDRHDQRFLTRVFTEWERAYCRRNILHLAGRWAAKEAVSKVLGLGIRGVGWREIEIKRTPLGQPIVRLHGNAERRRLALGLGAMTVSISHIRDLAVAAAVGETPPR